MLHRHLKADTYSLAAIDDIICHGAWKDWRDLHQEAVKDPDIMERIRTICQHFVDEPFVDTNVYWQFHLFWLDYVDNYSSMG
jgi:hypothetical protein